MRDYLRPPFIPPFWLLTAVVSIVVLDQATEQTVILGPPCNHFGWFLILGGLGVALYVDLIFKRRGTTILPFRKATSLVTTGPFRYSRNPVYAGMAAALLGFALTLGKALPLLVVPAFVWVIHSCFICREEASLEEAFGADYKSFKSQVRRWI